MDFLGTLIFLECLGLTSKTHSTKVPVLFLSSNFLISFNVVLQSTLFALFQRNSANIALQNTHFGLLPGKLANVVLLGTLFGLSAEFSPQ